MDEDERPQDEADSSKAAASTPAAPDETGVNASEERAPESLSWRRYLGDKMLIVAVLTLIVTIIIGGIGIWIGLTRIRSDVKDVHGSVERVEKSIMEQQFRITKPADGDSVNLVDVVRGETPFAGLNHYIVVTPIKAGVDFVQSGPVPVHAGGFWSGQAAFGSAAIGIGEDFLVRCLATNSALNEGPLVDVPEDAAFSDIITVIRK